MTGVSFSPHPATANNIACCSSDGNVQVWDVDSELQVKAHTAHAKRAGTAVVFATHPDKQSTVYSGDIKGGLVEWWVTLHPCGPVGARLRVATTVGALAEPGLEPAERCAASPTPQVVWHRADQALCAVRRNGYLPCGLARRSSPSGGGVQEWRGGGGVV